MATLAPEEVTFSLLAPEEVTFSLLALEEVMVLVVSLLVPEQTREVEVRAPGLNPRTSGTQIRPVDSLLALEEVAMGVYLI